MYVHIYNIYIYIYISISWRWHSHILSALALEISRTSWRKCIEEAEQKESRQSRSRHDGKTRRLSRRVGFSWDFYGLISGMIMGIIYLDISGIYIYITTILYGAFLSHGGSPSHHGCFKSKSWSSMTWMIRRIGGTPMTKRKPLYLAHRKYWDTIDRMVGWGFIWYCHHPCWFTGSLEEFNVSSWPWLNLLIFWRRGWTTNHILFANRSLFCC